MTFRLARFAHPSILIFFSAAFLMFGSLAFAEKDEIQPTGITDGVESFTTTLVDVLKPERAGESWIFLLSADGRALRVSDQDRSNIEVLLNAVGKPRFLQMSVSNEGATDRILTLSELPQTASATADEFMQIEPFSSRDRGIIERTDFHFDGYEMTPQGIFDFFRSMRLKTPSQCFHRAYRWAHQFWRNTGALSYKVFMFFSWKYIRTFNYHWWFHVAPYVFDDKGQEVVLDPTYLTKPVSMKEWTDKFLRNDPVCPTVTKYMGHSAHGQGQWCYLVKARMEVYHPNTVEAVNKGGPRVKTWDAGYLTNAVRGTRR